MDSALRHPAETRDPPRRAVIFGTVAVSILMISIDQTIVATALVAIQTDLDAPIAWASWVIAVYSLCLLVTMPIAGSIADQFGRKRIFMGAIVVFGSATLLCALAPTIEVLIIARAVQALGAGAFVPCASGIVAESFGENRDRAIGLFTSIYPVGAILGPVVGGVIVTHAEWRYIFVVNVPVCALLLILVARVVPRTDTRSEGRPDLIGAALLACCLSLGMLAFTTAGVAARLSGSSVAMAALATAAGLLFIRRTTTFERPIIPLALLKGRGLLLMNLMNLSIGAAAFGLGTLAPLYAEVRYGLSPLSAGSLLAVRALGMITLAGLAVWLLRITGYRFPMLAGLLATAAGLIMTGLESPGLSDQAWLCASLAITGIGMGLALPATNNASLQLAPSRVSAIVGVRGMFRQGGGMVSVACASILMTQSEAPGATLARIYLVFGIALACISLLSLRVPDHRGAW